MHGPNFVEAIRNQMRKGTNPLRVVNDQRGRPTYTPHLADAIIRLAQLAHDDETRAASSTTPMSRSARGSTSRARSSAIAATVTPVSSDEFPRPAKRPAYSVLSTERYERLTGVKPESWQEGLREYLHQRPKKVQPDPLAKPRDPDEARLTAGIRLP